MIVVCTLVETEGKIGIALVIKMIISQQLHGMTMVQSVHPMILIRIALTMRMMIVLIASNVRNVMAMLIGMAPNMNARIVAGAVMRTN